MRFNGEWIPYSALQRLHLSRAGDHSLRFALLPAGAYEIWGVCGPESTFTPPPREPVRVGLSAGEQTADIIVPK